MENKLKNEPRRIKIEIGENLTWVLIALLYFTMLIAAMYIDVSK